MREEFQQVPLSFRGAWAVGCPPIDYRLAEHGERLLGEVLEKAGSSGSTYITQKHGGARGDSR